MTTVKDVPGGTGPSSSVPLVSLPVVEGEVVVRLLDPQTGVIHTCKLSRVTWACNTYGFVVADPEEMKLATKIATGIAEIGEVIKPAPMGEPEKEETVRPTKKPISSTKKKQQASDDEEAESADVAIIPVG